jgi:hypothetical protein
MKLHLGALPGQYETGETFSDVLSYNHYGTKTIPPRPVLRIAAERTIPKNKKLIKSYLKNLLEYSKRGRTSDMKDIEVKLLTSLGKQSVAEAKRMIEGIEGLQPNAPATKDKKGFNKPLYVNGDLEKHLGYEVTED